MKISASKLLTEFRHTLIALTGAAGELLSLGLLHGQVRDWVAGGVAVATALTTALVPNVPATQTAPPAPVVGAAGP